MAELSNVSYRPVRAIALLLILEVVGLVALGAYEVARVDWRRIPTSGAEPPQEVIEVVAFVLFVPPAVLALLAAMSFLLLRRWGWLLAAISQGLSVAVCLWLYNTELQPTYVYPVMAYCVLMILYLNVHDVRTVFYPGRARKKRPGRAP